MVSRVGKANRNKKFKQGRFRDSDEKDPHLTPVEGSGSVEVPKGQWVDVAAGMRVAEGVYVDDAGVMRDENDHSVVANHHKCEIHGHCDRRGIQPNELVYGPNKAPWCPDCYPIHLNCPKVKEMTLRKLFNKN